MALSNFLREPLRETIETVAGVLAVAAWGGFAYWFATWFHVEHNDDFAFLCFLGLVVPLIVVLVAGFIHGLGTAICRSLGRYDPRPRQRY